MVLKAENISKSFLRGSRAGNRFSALSETDFTLNEGEIAVIYGKSGSGKSTLMNILTGLLTPDTGKVFAGETDLHSLKDAEISVFRNKNFGIVPQGQTAVNSLTVMENVLLPYTLYKNGEKESEGLKKATEFAGDILERTGIAGLKAAMPKELSGGELRRMAIARAVINNPDIIMADEPTADLDEENTRTILKIFRELADRGKSVLIITHDREVFEYADRIFEMKAGKITENTTKQQ